MRIPWALVCLFLVSTCGLASGQTKSFDIQQPTVSFQSVRASAQMQVFPIIAGTGKPGFSRQSGLQLTVDTAWVGNQGYHPVRMTLISPKKTTSEMSVKIVFHARRRWNLHNDGISVEKDFRFPQGTIQTTVTFLVPKYADWNALSQEVWIDGKKDDDLSANQNFIGVSRNNGDQLSILMLASEVESIAIRTAIGARNRSPRWIRDLQGSITMKAAELPQSWLAYSSLSHVLATTSELKNCASQNPKAFEALLRWVRSGGNLWVLDGGKNWEQLPEIEATLQLTSARKSGASTKSGPEARGWRVLLLSTQSSDPATAMLSLEPFRAPPNTKPARPASKNITPAKALDSRPWFVARAYGLGTIAAFRHDFRNDFRSSGWFNKNNPMDALEKTHLNWRLDWETRHGNDPSQGNSDFYNLQIPGVGQAPVLEFQLLISLFVIAIGPVNYWWLKRRRRLPMLLVTVPAAAAVSTVLLFAYGLLSDGLGTRVRARSFTLIDQRAGEVVCWGRLSYYAGLAPRGGLQMPADTALYPILPGGRSYRYSRRYAMQRREMRWAKDQQLTRGWLSARTPTQYQTITARATSQKLLLRRTESELHVTNQLGVEVLALLIQDHDGNIYQYDQLAPDESARLSPSSGIEMKSKLRKLIAQGEPEMPVHSNVNRWSAYSIDSSMPSNLMENHLRALVLTGDKTWGPGSYIAITSQGVCLPLGSDEVTEEASLHTVRGTW